VSGRSRDRKRRDELAEIVEKELPEVWRIARELVEKRKAVKRAEGEKRAKIEERNHHHRAEEERNRRTREAKLIMVLEKEEEKAKQNREHIEKLEKELRENWSKRASQDPGGSIHQCRNNG